MSSSHKHPMDPPINSRQTKRVEVKAGSSSSAPRVSDDPIVANIDKFVIAWLYKIDYFELPYDKQLKYIDDILTKIVNESGGKLDPRFTLGKTWDLLVEQHPDIIDEIIRCCNLIPPSFSRILELEYLYPAPTSTLPSTNSSREDLWPEPIEKLKNTYDATVKSWSQEYRGESADLLYNILKSYLQVDDAYARYVAFVQSSGTGKSRMLNELAKRIISISLNLGMNHPNSLPYPPSDHDALRAWVMPRNIGLTQDNLRKHYQAFMFGLLTVTRQRLEILQRALALTQNVSDEDASHQGDYPDQVDHEEKEYLDSALRLSRLALDFRERMTETVPRGGTDCPYVLVYGSYRKSFYEDVIKEAEKFVSTSQGSQARDSSTHRRSIKADTEERENNQPSVESAGRALRDFLDPHRLLSGEPILMICFDEAQSLTEPVKAIQAWTYFSELCGVIREVNMFPFFSAFLSTGGNFHQSSPDHVHDPSNRIQVLTRNAFAPITEIGFDEFAIPVSADGTWTLEALASTEFIAHLGRALFPSRWKNGDEVVRKTIITFTRSKLLGQSNVAPQNFTDPQKLACLSVRMGLGFRAADWSHREQEDIQVERHMRLCVSATAGFQSLVTISPSEPLLAEAAAVDMISKKWGAAEALLKHLKGSYLCVDERGGLIAVLILLLARDTALKASHRPRRAMRLDCDGHRRVVSVSDFLASLLNSPSDTVNKHVPTYFRTNKDKSQTLGQAFKDASVWFNHFVKVHDFSLINEDHLWQFVARGAAVVCASRHCGVDVLIPVVFKNRLSKTNVSAILFHITNDASYGDSIKQYLFDCMNPFDMGLFSGEMDSRLPIIRMVFALASDQSAVMYAQRPTSILSPKSTAANANFTTFDIWCAGVTDSTFKVIDPTEVHTYSELLLQSQVTFNPYGDSDEEVLMRRAAARRMMDPGATKMPTH